MEFEKRNNKNVPPPEGSKNLPRTVLAILLGIILLLLFVGWQYLNDTPSNAEEMVPTQPDVVSAQMDENGDGIKDDVMVDETMPDIELPSSVPEVVAKEEVKPPVKETLPPPPPVEAKKATPTATSTSNTTYTHTVAAGETFYSIATRYNLDVNTLKSSNTSVDPSNIKVGITRLQVPVRAIHTVGPGDILRVVAKKYDISVSELMKANGKSKNVSQRGEKLIIPVR